MQRYWVWFSLLKGISRKNKDMLLELCSDPEQLYRSGILPNGTPIDPDLSEAEQVVNVCNRKGIRIIPINDPYYPEPLRQIPDAPFVIYCRGVLPNLDDRIPIGVVGTRRSTDYGMTVTDQISRELVRDGGMIISGGAAGIDTAALWASLREGVPTVAVLGCGVDVTYPTTNRKLFMEIEQNGCILSEYTPGTRPTKWSFPARNRIISGLSKGTLVIEAPVGSGALITAKDAAKQGRPVFVVPGNINMESCAGSNQLLKEGAQAVFSGADILNFFTGKRTPSRKKTPAVEKKIPAEPKKVIDNPAPKPYIELAKEPDDLTEEERHLLSFVGTRPMSVDDLIAASGVKTSDALALLTMLTLRGLIMEHPGRLISRKLR